MEKNYTLGTAMDRSVDGDLRNRKFLGRNNALGL